MLLSTPPPARHAAPLPCGSGVPKAQSQLMRVFKLIAWMHSVMDVPVPPLVGRIVVPFPELREAQRLLRGSRGTLAASLPGSRGQITVKIEAACV